MPLHKMPKAFATQMKEGILRSISVSTLSALIKMVSKTRFERIIKLNLGRANGLILNQVHYRKQQAHFMWAFAAIRLIHT